MRHQSCRDGAGRIGYISDHMLTACRSRCWRVAGIGAGPWAGRSNNGAIDTGKVYSKRTFSSMIPNHFILLIFPRRGGMGHVSHASRRRPIDDLGNPTRLLNLSSNDVSKVCCRRRMASASFLSAAPAPGRGEHQPRQFRLESPSRSRHTRYDKVNDLVDALVS